MNDDVSRQAESLVRVEVDDGIATITLADPGRRNCVSRQMSDDVAAACERLGADRDVRVAILAADGPAFSAGGDVTSLANPDGDLAPVYRGFTALGKLTVPLVGAVGGPVIGAGMNFVLACDVVVAGRSATFDPSFLKLAIHPGGGHLWRMSQLMGRQATAATVIFGERLDADEAQARGLIWRAVDDAEVMPEVRRLAGTVASRSPEVVQRTKATLRASLPITDERLAVDLELVAQEWSMSRPAFREAADALLKRLQGGD